MSLAYQDEASAPCHLFMNNWSDWNDLHSLSDLGQLERSRTQRHVLKHRGKGVQRILFSLPHHQLYLISYQTEASRVKGSYLHWLSLGWLLPSALACTAETTPIEQVRSAFCMCVCAVVRMWAWGEGVEYLPRGYDKVTQGRQWTPEQWQTCQDRRGLTAQSEKDWFSCLSFPWQSVSTVISIRLYNSKVIYTIQL